MRLPSLCREFVLVFAFEWVRGEVSGFAAIQGGHVQESNSVDLGLSRASCDSLLLTHRKEESCH